MNWLLFSSTFMLIFLAELGDKTQLAVLSQSATASSKWTVFVAGSLALIVTTALGVLAGELIRRFVPDERYVKCAGGVLFLIFGCLMLREVFLPKSDRVIAEMKPLSRVSGWVGQLVIQQAAVFEKAAYEDYEVLAARAKNSEEKAVFERLALEERWHHEAMRVAIASGGGKDLAITPAMAGELPPVDELMQDAAKASQDVEHAIGHERAMSHFYRTLSRQCAIPRLKETFEALAVAEENHAQRLIALRK